MCSSSQAISKTCAKQTLPKGKPVLLQAVLQLPTALGDPAFCPATAAGPKPQLSPCSSKLRGPGRAAGSLFAGAGTGWRRGTGSCSQHCSLGGLREGTHAAGNTARCNHHCWDIGQGSFGVKHSGLERAGWSRHYPLPLADTHELSNLLRPLAGIEQPPVVTEETPGR